jgi:hypothetical protein
LSLALAVTETVPETVAPLTGAAIETVGAVVSAQAAVETLIEVRVEWLAATSKASTATVCVDPHVSPVTE